MKRGSWDPTALCFRFIGGSRAVLLLAAVRRGGRETPVCLDVLPYPGVLSALYQGAFGGCPTEYRPYHDGSYN